MKRIILLFAILGLTLILHSQYLYQNKSTLVFEGDSIGNTFYELQTNASSQNRIYCYDDGTISATYTIGYDWPNFSYDRGTGYNYFDGEEWSEWPGERIETLRTGWPSYAPLGEDGEIVAAHLSGSQEIGLLLSKRETKGIGDWTETLFQGPLGQESLLWPRMVTGGEYHYNIHLLSLTRPDANGGTLYQGLDGALLYSTSTDGGESWDILNQVLPGMDSSEYTGFTADTYAFTEPKDNYVAFVVGSYQYDLFLMKSNDYGQTFEKTIIWDHPYDSLTPTVPKDTFYCVDGSIDVALDFNGSAHVVFGIMRTCFNGSDWIFFKLTDGIGYWNESMDSFSSNINALNPTNHPESELVIDESLIGWSQDIDGDSIVSYLNNQFYPHAFYKSLGISSMVQIVSDIQHRLFILFSSVTETYDNGSRNYRRLWLRSSINNGQSWSQFYHLIPNNPIHIWHECVYPSMASLSDGFVYITYFYDYEPGLHDDEEPWGEIFVQFAKVSKDEIVGINQTKQSIIEFDVSQNFPNPFSESTTINVNLQKPINIKLEVINLLGEKVYELSTIRGNVGLNSFKIQSDDFSPGIYFYTVTAGESSLTKKMLAK